MDLEKRGKLIEEIDLQGGLLDSSLPSPAVSLELFFEGNDDPGSIGCNIPDDDYPGVLKFFKTFKHIRNMENVQDVLVRIYDVEDDIWPFADEVYILTSAKLEDVKSWVSTLYPSEVYSDNERNDGKDWKAIKPPNAPDLLSGMKAYYVWWD